MKTASEPVLPGPSSAWLASSKREFMAVIDYVMPSGTF